MLSQTEIITNHVNTEELGERHSALVSFSLNFLSLFIGGIIIISFLLDLAGLPVRIWTVCPLTILLLTTLFWNYWRKRRSISLKEIFVRTFSKPYSLVEFGLFGLTAVGILVYLVWLGRPSLLPVGTTVDSVHQFGLARYINNSGKLPIHALELKANLQDGLEYPPAFATLTALFSSLLNLDPVYLLYPLAACCTALSVAVTFAAASLLLTDQRWRLPLAAVAASFTLWPYGYTFGSITNQNYFAMVLAELLLLLSIYLLLSWQHRPLPFTAISFFFSLGALVIDYPTWILIPAISFAGTVLLQKRLDFRERLVYLTAVLLPCLILTFWFLKDRLQAGVGTVTNEGDVLTPDLARYGWVVLFLASAGLGFASWYKSWRPLAFCFILLGGEAAAFFLLKTLFKTGSYYSAYKLFYPATFFLALLAICGVSGIGKLLFKNRVGENLPQKLTHQAFLPLASTGVLVFSIGGLWLSHPAAERAYPVINADMVSVGEWMKQNLPIVEYSVGYGLPPGTPSYWVQVGLLGQPQGNRAKILLTGEPETFEQWFYNPDSEKYFFTDKLNRVNLDERLDLLNRSGEVGVLTRTAAYENTRQQRESMILRYRAELTENDLNLTAEGSFSAGASKLFGMGLVVEQENSSAVVYGESTPAEPGRERKQYLGIHLLLPTLKTTELYTDANFPPTQSFNPLREGEYTAYIEVRKEKTAVERRKLFSFKLDKNQKIELDPAQRIQTGQFVYDGPQPSNRNSASNAVSLGPDLPRFEGFKLTGVAKAGTSAQLALSWISPPGIYKSYKILLTFSSVGEIDFESGSLPLNGVYPTWFWPSNGLLTYTQSVKLPDKPGTYKLFLSLFDLTLNSRTPPVEISSAFVVN